MKKSKILTLLLSVVIAFGMWLYVITVVSPGSEETIENIPVILRNEANLEERGFMVITDEIPTVTLTLSGNRTDLAKVDRSNISLIVDLATVSERGTHTLTYKHSFPGSVADDAITVEYRYPSQIELEVEVLTKKEVPVQINYAGKLPDNYFADTKNVLLDNPTVEIQGPDPIVRKITQAVIDVNLEGRTENLSTAARYTLCDAEGRPVDAALITTDVAEVNLSLTIQRFKEIALEFDIRYGGGATVDSCLIEYEPKAINVAGPESVLETLEDTLILGVIDLSTIMEDTELTFDIELETGGITNLSNVETVIVSVQFPDLITKTFPVTQFEKRNVPEGMDIKIMSVMVPVTVRGPQDLIDAMTAENISIQVDYEKVHFNKVAGEIVIDADFAQVGAIGTYDDLSVQLVEAEEPTEE